jgi:hypothetical protein
MRTSVRFLGCFLLIGCVALLSTSAPAAPTEQPDFDRAILKQQGIEVAPKGPIHEAFARPADLNPQPTPPVPKQPPPPIPEIPPEQKPQGDNIDWIPGYWAWDADKNDFLWVSGLYRNMPAGRRYIPGYWTQGEQGWQWVPGFLAPERQADTQYVPRPPASLENGPSVPAPDQNSFYSPGTWYYDGSQFAWRPGYWSPYQSGRIWVNSFYTWTPAGWVFVPGYWDYALADRGMLFAPVYFNGPYWNQPGRYYQPSVAIGLGGLLNGFFYRNGYPNYYYGPYFGPGYAGLGFMPWYGGAFWGNPFYGYYRWNNRGNPGWFNGIRNGYVNRTAGPVQFASINNLRGQAFNGRSLVNVTPAQAAAQRTSINQFRQLTANRSTLERTALAQGGGAKSARLTSGTIANSVSPANIGKGAVGANAIRTPAFNGANLRTPTFNSGLNNANIGRQGLTGRAPTVNSSSLRSPTFTNSATHAYNYQPKNGITGTTRNSTQMYYPRNNATTFTPRSGAGSYQYRSGGSAGVYRPSTTYRPSGTYRSSAPAYRGGSYGGGGRSGGGGGGRGGHR